LSFFERRRHIIRYERRERKREAQGEGSFGNDGKGGGLYKARQDISIALETLSRLGMERCGSEDRGFRTTKTL
jgi:hypothetical protein